MAQTNFSALTDAQKIVWSRDLWEAAREMMFINKFTGTDSNSVIQRISELTKTEKGEKVLMHLVADLVQDGVVGDSEREGNEEEIKSYNDDITIDLISHQVRNKGKMSDQKTVIDFRTQSRDKLAYWIANRCDQLAFLTLAGVDYGFNNDGSARGSGAFSSLAFAGDVSAPSANRHLRVSGTGLASGDTSLVTAADTITYNHIVDIVTEAKTNYIKGLNVGGKEMYVAFVRPEILAQLKKDPDCDNIVPLAA